MESRTDGFFMKPYYLPQLAVTINFMGSINMHVLFTVL